MPEQSPMSAFQQELRPTLRPEPLSGVKRLCIAQLNPYYLDIDLVEPMDSAAERRHQIDVTPFHEAGHAVAHVLNGDTFLDIKMWRDGWGRGKAAGLARIDPIAISGRERCLGYLTAIYAGPVAEIRYNDTRVVTGAQSDLDYANIALQEMECTGVGKYSEMQSWAWREACRMFMDERVWAATTEIAGRLCKSISHPARVSGGAVRTIVHRHLPDEWMWSDPSPRMRKRRAA